MIDTLFHPAVGSWFQRAFEAPSAPQIPAWTAVKSGAHTLIAAPTGSGKTLAAFLAAIDDLVRLGDDGLLDDETHVLYISPLKALSNDIQKNLQEPLAGITGELNRLGRLDHGIRVAVRSGDTPAYQRAAMIKKPPHIVVTTPESLFILLTSDGGRRLLKTVRTVIVDEIHAMVGTKRGTHLALSLERLSTLCETPPVRLGLSATQKPIAEVARFLVGSEGVAADGTPQCEIIDAGHTRQRDLAIEVPSSPLESVMSLEVWQEVYDRLATLIEQHRTTIVFVNTRRLAERVTRLLAERLGDDAITSHHGSLSKEHRLDAEQRLKAGKLRALVATASLELGIDIGDVDLVCQIGTTKSIAALLQRVGRSGHHKGGVPKGRLFPLTRDELVESAALLDSVRREELDQLIIPDGSLDILAQQVVAASAFEPWREDDLYRMARRAWPYRNLARDEFDAVLRMLADGFTTRRGRRGAYLHRDVIRRVVRGRRAARLTAVTNGGAIPDNADYQVLQEPSGMFVGTVNEDFAIESLAGDIFQLGNTSWRILKVESGKVRVEDAKGQPPSIPFWLGEAPSRTNELSVSVSRLRTEVARRGDPDPANAVAWLTDTVGLGTPAAEQVVDYLVAARAALGVMPSRDSVVLERFFDESGGMQLVLHAPFGSRINRAWGLALRKRFCRKFNFELQAAATEDALVLSLGVTHSFPLDDVFRYLRSATVRDVLIQALLDAPMFQVRWRWNAGRSLAVPRFRGGKKVPSPLQRMQAEDLLSVVFPDQVACQENIPGEREIPDHPLVAQTIRDCLEEAMDIDGFVELLRRLEAGELQLHARDVTEPSPLALEILSARPYAFLDDAPLEERRTQAVMSRRWLDPESASDLGALDLDAIARVREETRPDARHEDELHDTLVILGCLTDTELAAHPDWNPWLDSLCTAGRATRVGTTPATQVWVAAERLPQWRAAFPHLEESPVLALPRELTDPAHGREEAAAELVRSRLEGSGPVTPAQIIDQLGVPAGLLDTALAILESEGAAMQGRFTPGATETEWCDRRLLARIHRYTLQRLRKEIEPVTATEFLRYLAVRHHLDTDDRPEGPQSLAVALERLEGYEAAAASWEGDLLPARVANYDPAWLDGLCLAGRITWGRLRPPAAGSRTGGPVRSTPIALYGRRSVRHWLPERPDAGDMGSTAALLHGHLHRRGAQFFDELVEESGLLSAQVEEGLRELVAWGAVTADSFRGLRALLVPAHRRGRNGRMQRPAFDLREAGRWSLLRSGPGPEDEPQDAVEHITRTLLHRYGVVFRRLMEREATPPWRQVLRVLRTWEARGDIRGGRFVAGFTGEQYALPGAVDEMRAVRRREPSGRLVSISGADPLNLTGILVPGVRVPSLAGNRILLRDGEVVGTRIAGEDRLLVPFETEAGAEASRALRRSDTPAALRTYLRR